MHLMTERATLEDYGIAPLDLHPSNTEVDSH